MRINALTFVMTMSLSLMTSLAQSAEHAQSHTAMVDMPTTAVFDDQQHAKEHGGQRYQLTTIESKWTQNKSGQGQLQSDLETWFGGDTHKVFLRLAQEKVESEQPNYHAELLYSRNISDFWDVQAGVRYRHDDAKDKDKDQTDVMFGLYGMAQYFFETEAYVYAGQNQRWSMNLHSERDFLLTQKLIVQPYVEANVVFSDESKYASKTGLNSVEFGLESRYEISKKFMPFIDVSYQYQKGVKETPWQVATGSNRDWYYGAGLRVKF